ncbi:MAG: hypothetical protein WCK00_11095, partial [Deltaproteobacteria bacterium]
MLRIHRIFQSGNLRTEMPLFSKFFGDSEAKREFKPPVGWLLGQQLLAGIKWIALYSAYGEKLDFRDWMQGDVKTDFSDPKEGEEEFWFDYIADTGDGQKATYCVAYLCHGDLFLPMNDRSPGPGQVSLSKENGYCLPRGKFLFVGGDTAYHIADLATLAELFQTPFNWAFDDRCDPNDSDHVRNIYAIPGNHDYYDFLDGFNRQFRTPLAPACLPPNTYKQHGTQLRLKGFKTSQTASFLAIQLPWNWWLWGLDSQNGKIDKRQLAFFRGLNEGGPPKKLIIATPEPSTVFGKWAVPKPSPNEETEKGEMIETFKKLNLTPSFLKHLNGTLAPDQCRLDMSGDIHHYDRYWGPHYDTDTSRENYAS